MSEGLARARLIGANELGEHWAPCIEAMSGRSLLPWQKLANLLLVLQALPDGDVIECGSYRGGSALFLAEASRRLGRSGRVFAVDTFEGMPEPDSMDGLPVGAFSDADLPGFRARASELGLTNLTICKGRVEDVLPGLALWRLAMIHIDLDNYAPCATAQTILWPRLMSGGALIYDDPPEPSTPGAAMAALEMVAQGARGEQFWPHWVFRK